jgi:hypothetical protein
MTTYAGVYEFTEAGMAAFKQIMLGELDETAIAPTDAQFARRVSGTGSIDDEQAGTSKELAERVLNALGQNWTDFLPRPGVWAWLTFVLRDVLFPKDSSGKRKPKEIYRWYPADPGDYQKGQRHLVRMPVVLLANLGDAADHLLCGRPHILPEIREQLTSQQDMFNLEFQRAARQLYYDLGRGKLKKGAGDKTAGTPRRLAKVRKQLDVTWNLYDLNAKRIVGLLPKEFDKFRTTQP